MRNSEKIQEILTSAKGRKLLNQISPIYDNAYQALNILQTQGLELDDLIGMIDKIRALLRPQTATDGLKYWESEYGLPVNTSLTFKERRDKIAAKCSKGPKNPYAIAKIASAACGVSCRVEENTSKNTFDIYVSAINGDIIDEASIRNAVTRSKPSQKIFRIKYEQGLETEFYTAITMYQAQKFEIRQVN